LRMKYNIPKGNCIADEDGVGGGVVDNTGIVGFKNNSTPLEENGQATNYKNLQTQCLYRIAERINSNGIYISAELSERTKEMITEELEQIKSDNKDGQKLSVINKDTVKQAIGRSPDYRDMLLSEDYLNKISEKIEVVAKEGASKLYCTTLGDIGKICMCKRILKEQTFSNGEVPFYKIGTFGKSADAFISKQLFDEYKQKYNYPKKGEILISASGTIGKAIVFDGQDSYFQDSNIVWLSHDETKVLNRYLYYFYQIINWNPSTGGTISRLYNYNLVTQTSHTFKV